MTTSSPRGTGGFPWMVAIGAGLSLLIIMVAFAIAARGGGGETGSTPAGEAPAGGVSDEMRELAESLARREPGDPMALGEVDAPVVMIAYSDYQCPFCGKWVRETQPELVERYVDEGTLRIEWREFPYMGEASKTIAIGARAAAEQGKFWDYHGLLYNSQDELKDAGPKLEELLSEMAARIGLNQEQFTADLRRTDLAKQVEEDFAQGQRIGVTGTPAFLINGEPVMGAQPLSTFTATIEAAAERAGA